MIYEQLEVLTESYSVMAENIKTLLNGTLVGIIVSPVFKGESERTKLYGIAALGILTGVYGFATNDLEGNANVPGYLLGLYFGDRIGNTISACYKELNKN